VVKTTFRYFKIVFFLGIGVFFIWLFLHNLTPSEKSEIIQSFAEANYIWVLFSIFFGLIAHILRALRWNLMLAPMKYHPRLLNTFSAVMIGYMANLALPRLGEITRCGVLNRYEKIPINKSIGTVIAERSVDLIMFFILFFLTIFVFVTKMQGYYEQKFMGPMEDKFSLSGKMGLYGLVTVFIVLLIVTLLIIYRKKLIKIKLYAKAEELAVGLWHGLKSIAFIPKPGLFIFYSVLIWVMYYFMTYFCFLCFIETEHLGFGAGMAVLMFGTIGIMLVQGGIGIYPAIVAETLIVYGIANTTGYALGWLTWSAQTLLIIIFGSLSFLMLPFINSKKHG